MGKGGASYLDLLDMQMVLGGTVSGTLVDEESGRPISGLNLTLSDGFINGKRQTDFEAQLTTDAQGRFRSSSALFPGRYHIEITNNDVNHRLLGGSSHKFLGRKIGIVNIRAGWNIPIQLTTHELTELLDPFVIEGFARGNDGELIVDGSISPRADGGATQLRSSSPQLKNNGTIRFRLGPIKRQAVSETSTHGVGEVDLYFDGESYRQGYILVGHVPTEPLRLTDDPNRAEVENGIRYIRPGQPIKLEFLFARSDDVDNRVKANSLIVRLQDELGEPVPQVYVRVYDPRNPHGKLPPTFQNAAGRANSQGLATFPQHLSVRDAKRAFCIQVDDASLTEFRLQGNHVIFSDGQSKFHDPRVTVAKDDKDNVLVTFTMRKIKRTYVGQQAGIPRRPPPLEVELLVLQADGKPASGAIVTPHIAPSQIGSREVPVYNTDPQGRVKFRQPDTFQPTRYRILHDESQAMFDLDGIEPTDSNGDGVKRYQLQITLKSKPPRDQDFLEK